MLRRNIKKIIVASLILVVITLISTLIIFVEINKIKKVQLPKNDEELGIKTEIYNNEVIEKKQDIKEDIKEPIITNIALFGDDRMNKDENGRSDSIIIISINEKSKSLKMCSIMRDSYVEVEGYGMTKINHAYSYGGAALAIKTINQNFNLNIRDFVKVDFHGIEKIVDYINGVEVEVKDYEVPGMVDTGINKAGTYNLNGEQALAYSRIRHYGNSDFERTQRQRVVIEKLFEKLNKNNTVQLIGTINELLPYLETSLGKTDLINLALKVSGFSTSTMEQQRIPYDGHSNDLMLSGVYYLQWEKEYTIKELQKFLYN